MTNVSYSYTYIYGANNVKYYRLISLTYGVAAVYDGFVIQNSRIEIDNNGIGSSTTVMGQRQYSNLGTSTSGTVNGSSSWTPSISLDASTYTTATRFYVQVKAKRGTTVYYDDWMRSF